MRAQLLASIWLPLAMNLCHGQGCQLTSKADDTINKRVGPPVIQGTPFHVPAMQWRFLGGSPQAVEARYQWQWIEYPYPEHPFGAWVTAGETVECPNPGAEMTVPAHTVQPRGWYKGTYTALPWSKPRFHQVEFVIIWERNCEQRLMLSPRTLLKFRDQEATIKRTCGVPESMHFIQKKR